MNAMQVTSVWRQWGWTNKASSANRYRLHIGQTEYYSASSIIFYFSSLIGCGYRLDIIKYPTDRQAGNVVGNQI
jgi:hypothetical protein